MKDLVLVASICCGLSVRHAQVVAHDHLLVRLDKHAGALAELSRRLADASVDVRGMHIVNKDENAGIVALETASLEDAREVLKDILVWEA